MSEYTREQVIEMVTRGKSLKGANLFGLDLSGVDFRPQKYGGPCEKKVILSNANLSNAKFNEADLSYVNFDYADLSYADFDYADLSYADLSAADLSGADLSSADLSNANLSAADLSDTNFSDANLSNANLSYTDLNYADLSDADLSAADLSYANLSNTDLVEANFNRADLSNANLSGADFEYANLEETDISGANIYCIKTYGWKIKNIKCSYAYQCDWKAWQDPQERENYRHNFVLGEFEEIYKNFPTIEVIFEKYSHLDHLALLAVIDKINKKLPEANLRLRTLENAAIVTATLITETREAADQVANIFSRQLTKIETELSKIKTLLTQQKEARLSLPDWFTRRNEIVSNSSGTFLNRPIKVHVSEQTHMHFSSRCKSIYNSKVPPQLKGENH